MTAKKKKTGLYLEDGKLNFYDEGCGCCTKRSKQEDGDFTEKVWEYHAKLKERMLNIEKLMESSNPPE